jgi:hypothetical protein
MPALAPHPPFAISAGIGAIGWTSALPDFLAGDAHASKAVICRLHPTLRLFQSLPARKPGDGGLSSSDNAVDGEVLRELTAADLKDLGVTLVGHRRKLLAAITVLRAEPPTVASVSGKRDICSNRPSHNRCRTRSADGDVL